MFPRVESFRSYESILATIVKCWWRNSRFFTPIDRHDEMGFTEIKTVHSYTFMVSGVNEIQLQ